MTDYPTRAEIDAAAETIEALQTYVDRGVPAWGVTWSGLETAREILTQLDAVPGVLHYPEPEPEPKPTALRVLREAHERALGRGLTAETGILGVAVTYAEAHREWFAEWHSFEWTTSALLDAANKAEAAGNGTAYLLLSAAARIAGAHLELFGGDA